ncbi:MAG: transposase, partial [Candidatus Schekmanbacteria bacterium]|nr:transposase [Candidatus Schekmanbacteria bacterium]
MENQVFAFLVRAGLISDGRIRQLLGWKHSGFDFYVGDGLQPDDKATLTKLAAYILRAPVAYERMRYERELGLVVFQIEHPYQKRPLVSVDVLDFLARLSLRLPEERERLPVYYGVHSSTSKHRTNVDGVGRGDDAAEAEHDARECRSRARRWWRKKWAEMIRRVFLADPLTCP